MMERLYQAGTKSSPEVDFNPGTGILKLSGQSYPENASVFYQELFTWLKSYLPTASGAIVAELRLSYMNTSSTKCLMDMLYMLEDAFNGGGDVSINWYYIARNRSMRECGEEFREDLSVPFNIIAVDAD